MLYERVVEVDEDVVLPLGDEPDRCQTTSACVCEYQRPGGIVRTSDLLATAPSCAVYRVAPATLQPLCSWVPATGYALDQVVFTRRNGKDPAKDSEANPMEGRRLTTVTGEVVCIRRAPDLDALRTELRVRLASVSLAPSLLSCCYGCALYHCEHEHELADCGLNQMV